MSILSWFMGKSKKKQGYDFTDSDRDASAELRAKRKEIEMLKLERENELHKLKIERQRLELMQEIDELKNIYAESDEDDGTESSTELELIKMFAPMLIKNNQNTPNINGTAAPLAPNPPQTQTAPSAQHVHLTDEQLNEIWNNTPKMAKMFAKKSNDDVVRTTIKSQINNIDDDSVERALKIIRGE
jgi:hypothetical protein